MYMYTQAHTYYTVHVHIGLYMYMYDKDMQHVCVATCEKSVGDSWRSLDMRESVIVESPV